MLNIIASTGLSMIMYIMVEDYLILNSGSLSATRQRRSFDAEPKRFRASPISLLIETMLANQQNRLSETRSGKNSL